jgi:hypothetical protein
MVFFNKAVMNGATLFGVALTLTALGFLDSFHYSAKIYLFIGAGFYFIGSILAFFFPEWSRDQ